MPARPIDLGWMRIFFEVGRSGNFTVAAERLGLSQPAVSYQIRRIEAHLQVALLERRHRGVALTPEGRRLFEAVRRAVEDVDGVVQGFRRSPRRPALRLSTDYAFSALWLMPRMHAYRALYPDVDIQLVATHREERARPAESEVAVVFGTRDELGRVGTLILPERVVPVCAPGFLKQNGPLDSPDAIARAILLHLDTQGPSPWYDWQAYLRDLGTSHDLPDGRGVLCFNTYALVVQAAIAGEGLALGWLGLVDPLLEAGLLIKTGPVLQAPERGYWILPPEEATAETDQLCAWLVSGFASVAAVSAGSDVSAG
ncbi:putative choline sulfate-utilization transcription factor [Neorhizobium galegae]|uniref:choline sulfate utilization transcriptional regulator n=1 Tax=Neorhizobium galegae TaxID=399 RepID=UPI001AE1D746|nr:LysR family transcriptional regulator [Neorhizobium galegae]MBP2548287.1 putative choline sulfate-utilization transcription factor [Neorhizobium galegae]